MGGDSLTGGVGADIFAFDTALDPNTNVDRILRFDMTDDLIQLDAVVFSGIGHGVLDAAGISAADFLIVA